MKKYFTFDKSLNLKPSGSQISKNKVKKKINLLANNANIGYYLITPLLVGVFLGLYLDKLYKKDFFILLGIILGLVSTFYNLYRLTKK